VLALKLNAKEFKRKQQTPWQPKQRAAFSQAGEQTGIKSAGVQARGRGRGRGRGRVVARNQPWVSGGVLKAGDFLGLRDNSAKYDDYTQLAESARSFAAASTGTLGYESYEDYGQAFAQQEPQRGGSNSSNTMFTAYGGYNTQTGTSQGQTPGQSASRGRGRGFGTTRGGAGGGVTKSPGKTSVSAAGASATYRPRYGEMGYGVGVGTTVPQLMQTASQPVATEQYATAAAGGSYTSAGQQQQQQQLYDTYTGYDYAESNAAYPQAAYYTSTDGQYLTTETGIQYYSQF